MPFSPGKKAAVEEDEDAAGAAAGGEGGEDHFLRTGSWLRAPSGDVEENGSLLQQEYFRWKSQYARDCRENGKEDSQLALIELNEKKRTLLFRIGKRNRRFLLRYPATFVPLKTGQLYFESVDERLHSRLKSGIEAKLEEEEEEEDAEYEYEGKADDHFAISPKKKRGKRNMSKFVDHLNMFVKQEGDQYIRTVFSKCLDTAATVWIARDGTLISPTHGRQGHFGGGSNGGNHGARPNLQRQSSGEMFRGIWGAHTDTASASAVKAAVLKQFGLLTSEWQKENGIEVWMSTTADPPSEEDRHCFGALTVRNGAPNNPFVWYAALSFDDLPESLVHRSLQAWSSRYGSPPTVFVQIKFPARYPEQKPIVRIVRPIFTDFTGSIFGGAPHLLMLNQKAWSRKYPMSQLLLSLKEDIVKREGEVVLTTRACYPEKMFQACLENMQVRQKMGHLIKVDDKDQAKFYAYSAHFVRETFQNAIRSSFDYGNKVLLPTSFMAKMQRRDAEYFASGTAACFKLLTHRETSTYCGVFEFTSPMEDMVVLPDWMMKSLMIEDGTQVTLAPAELPKIAFCKLQPHSDAWGNVLEDSGMEPNLFLAEALKKYTTLCRGQTIVLGANAEWDASKGLQSYTFTVVELKPEIPACALWTDFYVDLPVGFEPPLSCYMEPEPRDGTESKDKDDEQTEEEKAEAIDRAWRKQVEEAQAKALRRDQIRRNGLPVKGLDPRKQKLRIRVDLYSPDGFQGNKSITVMANPDTPTSEIYEVVEVNGLLGQGAPFELHTGGRNGEVVPRAWKTIADYKSRLGRVIQRPLMATRCDACHGRVGLNDDRGRASSSTAPAGEKVADKPWECASCTFINQEHTLACSICTEARVMSSSVVSCLNITSLKKLLKAGGMTEQTLRGKERSEIEGALAQHIVVAPEEVKVSANADSWKNGGGGGGGDGGGGGGADEIGPIATHFLPSGERLGLCHRHRCEWLERLLRSGRMHEDDKSLITANFVLSNLDAGLVM